MKVPILDDYYVFKEKLFARLRVDRFAGFLNGVNITPNKISLIGIGVGLISVGFLFDNSALFVCFYITNRLLDALDGYVARKFNRITRAGDRLDHWGDLVVHAGLLVKSIFYPDLTFLGSVALFTYIGEFFLLQYQNLSHRKFPTSAFALFYLFGLFEIGLIYQVIYQVFSYTYFQLFLKEPKQE